MIASPVPDMQGGREQSVWFRFQQLVCGGGGMLQSEPDSSCKLKGLPQYYDTYWYSNSPGNITNRWIRPDAMAVSEAAPFASSEASKTRLHRTPPATTATCWRSSATGIRRWRTRA